MVTIKKLEYYGIRGVALEWFRNYLTDRKQYVSYCGTNSGLHDVTCGVPQGSVLGPLLFIIYTNDLPTAITKSKCILFADDTTIFASSNKFDNLHINMKNDMKSLSDWFSANKLSLNVAKTNFIVFKPKRTNVDGIINTMELGNKIIHRVTTTKFLGIHIDDELEWGEHIDYVAKKISSGSYAIRSAKRYLSVANLRSIYFCLVHSHIAYGIMIWGTAFQYRLHRLVILQKKCIRNVSKKPFNEVTSPLYKQLNIPKLSDIFYIQLGKCMYLYNNGYLSPTLRNLFTINAEVHDHNTRQRFDPHVVARTTCAASKTFIHEGPKFWLSLPPSLQSSTSKKSFNYHIKQHIISSY